MEKETAKTWTWTESILYSITNEIYYKIVTTKYQIFNNILFENFIRMVYDEVQ